MPRYTMRKQTNRCACKTRVEFQMNDSFNSIACETCFEIISYEIKQVEQTKSKKQKIERGTLSDFINILNMFRSDIC